MEGWGGLLRRSLSRHGQLGLHKSDQSPSLKNPTPDTMTNIQLLYPVFPCQG